MVPGTEVDGTGPDVKGEVGAATGTAAGVGEGCVMGGDSTGGDVGDVSGETACDEGLTTARAGARARCGCPALPPFGASSATKLGVPATAGRAGATASCRRASPDDTATESPNPTERPGATLKPGATESVFQGCRLSSTANPSATSRAIAEKIANPGNPFPTAAEREAICSRYR